MNVPTALEFQMQKMEICFLVIHVIASLRNVSTKFLWLLNKDKLKKIALKATLLAQSFLLVSPIDSPSMRFHVSTCILWFPGAISGVWPSLVLRSPNFLPAVGTNVFGNTIKPNNTHIKSPHALCLHF